MEHAHTNQLALIPVDISLQVSCPHTCGAHSDASWS